MRHSREALHHPLNTLVIPAQVGIQRHAVRHFWIPAFAGITHGGAGRASSVACAMTHASILASQCLPSFAAPFGTGLRPSSG